MMRCTKMKVVAVYGVLAGVLAPQPVSADVVHADDVIVHGNICTGSTDCADGRVFNSDLEVSSLNPEIHFFDTSVGHDDWEIEADIDNLRFKNHVDGGAIVNVVTLSGGAPANSLFVSPAGDVGLGTATPQAAVHLLRGNGNAQVLVEETNGTTAARSMFRMVNNGGSYFSIENTASGSIWWFVQENSAPNRFIITSNASPGPKFALSNSGDLAISGSLTTVGPSCGGGCDAVFSPGYPIDTIEEHAAAMWRQSHLPEVGPTASGEQVNLSEKVGGLINELEKAHIYIERLHEQAKQQKAAFESALAEKDHRLAELEQRMAKMEALLRAKWEADD